MYVLFFFLFVFVLIRMEIKALFVLHIIIHAMFGTSFILKSSNKYKYLFKRWDKGCFCIAFSILLFGRRKASALLKCYILKIFSSFFWNDFYNVFKFRPKFKQGQKRRQRLLQETSTLSTQCLHHCEAIFTNLCFLCSVSFFNSGTDVWFRRDWRDPILLAYSVKCFYTSSRETEKESK